MQITGSHSPTCPRGYDLPGSAVRPARGLSGLAAPRQLLAQPRGRTGPGRPARSPAVRWPRGSTGARVAHANPGHFGSGRAILHPDALIDDTTISPRPAGQAQDLQAGTCLHSPTLRMEGQITANGCTGPQPLVRLGRQGKDPVSDACACIRGATMRWLPACIATRLQDPSGRLSPPPTRSNPHGWRDRAACLDEGPLAVLPDRDTGPAIQQIEDAKAVCRRCEVVDTCLKWAIRSGQDAGLGGLSKTSARAQAPQRPCPPRRLIPHSPTVGPSGSARSVSTPLLRRGSARPGRGRP